MEGTSSLEMALDRATERYMSSLQNRHDVRRAHPGSRETTALAHAPDASLQPTRLSWRGIEVSPEFQDYAMRVARGEQLAPYRGPVLARPCAEFPWGEPPRESTQRIASLRAPGRAFGAVIGALALVMAALGLGVEPSPHGTSRAGAPLASPPAPPPLPAVMAEPTPPEPLGEEPIGTVLASAEPPAGGAAAEAPRPSTLRPTPLASRAPLPRPQPSTSSRPDAFASSGPLATQLAPAPDLEPGAPAAPATTSRLTLPSRASAAAPAPSEFSGPSALFADRPSF